MKKKISPKQHLNSLVKAGMYVSLFVVIPALFVDLNLRNFTFREAFMPGILFLFFLLSKGYIFTSCLKLTNKWYLRIDAFFIVVFAGIYIIRGHSKGYLTLLYFAVCTTFFHFFFMLINIAYEGLTPLKERILNPEHLFQRRMMDLVDVIKPVIRYSRKQLADNFRKKRKNNSNIDIELVTDRFFNSIDKQEFPVTSKEIIKIYKKLNINIFKQRQYNKSDFLNILITLNFIKSNKGYNSLRRSEDSKLKKYLLGGSLKKLLKVIAIFKEVDCHDTCDKVMYDYWITTESSLD